MGKSSKNLHIWCVRIFLTWHSKIYWQKMKFKLNTLNCDLFYTRHVGRVFFRTVNSFGKNNNKKNSNNKTCTGHAVKHCTNTVAVHMVQRFLNRFVRGYTKKNQIHGAPKTCRILTSTRKKMMFRWAIFFYLFQSLFTIILIIYVFVRQFLRTAYYQHVFYLVYRPNHIAQHTIRIHMLYTQIRVIFVELHNYFKSQPNFIFPIIGFNWIMIYIN